MASVEPLRDPWPASLPGFGVKRLDVYAPCVACEATGGEEHTSRWRKTAEDGTLRVVEIHTRVLPGTWIRYGTTPLCRPHAHDLADDLLQGRATPACPVHTRDIANSNGQGAIGQMAAL